MMTHNKGRKKEIVHIRNVLRKVLHRPTGPSAGDLTRIWDLWDQAVGPVIAASTHPAAFRGKLLLVHAASSTWLHQLQFMKEDILRKVNNPLGEGAVEDIKFKIGPLGP
ncbi:hypothetical protein D3OALGA1CA_3170 [Olavius algarvensis associated proteobacterium Delta 3]|nr:hypothetical protein D3OALGA1CA_3170 [Olavius algarvensis associated proteobacterium Delta 3]